MDIVGSRVLTGGTTLVPVGWGGRVYNINVVASGTTNVVSFYTGGSGVTLQLQEEEGKGTYDYGNHGQEFPNGIYCKLGDGVTRVLVAFRREQQNQP